MVKRADATLDLIDALTVAGHVDSPVALSEELLFRRQFSSVYDVLNEKPIDEETLKAYLYEAQPTEAETIAGYEVYAVDCTPEPHPEAKTLPDRGKLKSQTEAVTEEGLKSSWLMRLVKWRSSWVAPLDVRRVSTASTDSQTAVDQVKALEERSPRLKVVVADSLYGNHYFLAVFLTLQTVFALVRLRGNLKLYENPPPRRPKTKGGKRKHGSAFKLANPSRPPDRQESIILFGQTIRLMAWHGLHLRQLAGLVGMVLRVEFLKADGTPRYKKPMWLFWTGPLTVSLADLCRMYLWRFAIEHAFRFFKQRLGLNTNLTPSLDNLSQWRWLIVLAYWQLLLIASSVEDFRPPWHPRPPLDQPDQPFTLTPGQVKRGALRYLMGLGTPARSPKPTGKGHGRPKGYRPAPRQRYEVVRKGAKPPKKARQKRC